MTFTSPISLFIAVLIAIALFVLAWMRRPALPSASLWLAAGGVVCLMLAAGGISCRSGREPRVAVMIDCSPSTRGASFRDLNWVKSRAGELLGDRPTDFYAFADSTRKLGASDAVGEMPSDHTSFDPPPDDAVLLFSDGRFDAPPVTPPVYAVIDPALASPIDASVVDLEERGTQMVADVKNTGSPRELVWVNQHRQSATAPTGSTVLSTHLVTTTEPITARLSPGDAWPENDALSIRPSPPTASQRWWVGDSPPRGWMQIAPANLPMETSAWLGPAIVVLNNIPVDTLGPQAQDRLTQYVRDLGGALVIGGGDHAFAAGFYPGSELESLSPLSSSPPEPVNHWVLLVDSSGSMSEPAGNVTRFKIASDALVTIIRELPRSDLVSIGSFARELRWWSAAKKASDTATLELPPADVAPNGPTNLEAALQQITQSLPDSPPIELLVLTDAEAQFTDAVGLAAQLKSHHVRVNALLVCPGSADSPLHRVVDSTGGKYVAESDANKWTNDVRKMLRASMPDQILREPSEVDFSDILQSVAPRTVSLMNSAWLKQSATEVAASAHGTDHIAAAAKWTVGSGDVVALAFSPSEPEIAAIEQAIARHPRDPRFNITWRARATLHIRVDAISNGDHMNDLHLALEMNPGPRQPIPQTAPGTYEIDLPAPRSPAIASILLDERVLDRFAIAGRYAREFDAVGNDIDALRNLTERSGGALIEPSRHDLIDIPDTRRITSLAGLFAFLGCLFIAGALVLWRIG
jgi:hypothetical protein